MSKARKCSRYLVVKGKCAIANVTGEDLYYFVSNSNNIIHFITIHCNRVLGVCVRCNSRFILLIDLHYFYLHTATEKRKNKHNDYLKHLPFPPSQSCVSLPRPTIFSRWKCFIKVHVCGITVQWGKSQLKWQIKSPKLLSTNIFSILF